MSFGRGYMVLLCPLKGENTVCDAVAWSVVVDEVVEGSQPLRRCLFGGETRDVANVAS